MILALAEAERNIKNVMAREAGSKLFILAAISGLLLTLAFPRWNLWPLAWVGFLPLFYALDRAPTRLSAFLVSFTAGFSFFLLSVSWLRHVTVFGMFFVVILQALYWGLFGVAYSVVGATRRVVPTLILSAGWVALELIRSELPVWGFAWNLLGNSQASNRWIVQLASVGGVYSVSFLVFLGNLVIYESLKGARPLLRGRKGPGPFGFGSGFLFLLLFSTILVFGWSRFEVFNPRSFLRVSTLQGNIPQILKWDAEYKRQIVRIYLNLTKLASYDISEIIVWPEAAFPGFFNVDPLAQRVRRLIGRLKIPLVMGSPHAGKDGYYNSAYLLNPSGEVAGRYDKIRLVPFGEYVPWKPVFGFLERYAYSLGISDFSPGKEFTVFELPSNSPVDGRIRFSTLICFEDIFPNLARTFVNRGADFLLVLTNDAWFGKSSAPYQHLQASQLRAIENGVSIVRAANTGVSAFINPLGEAVERVHNQDGKDTFVMGGLTYPVPLAKESTLFRKGGWLFPYLCLVLFLADKLVYGKKN